MRAALWTLLLAATAVAGGWWLAGLSGSVTMTLGAWTVETATSVFLAALLVLTLSVAALLRLTLWLAGVPARLLARLRSRPRGASGAGEAALTRAMVSLAAGDGAEARAAAGRARRLLGDTAQTLMLAAEAERLTGDEARATVLFRRLADLPGAGLLGLRGLYRQAVARADHQAAADLLQRAAQLHPAGQWVREERETLAARGGRWREALALAAPGSSRATYAVAAALSEADAADALRLARQAARDHPEFPPAALVYARRLRESGKADRALEVLREAWSRNPVPDLAEDATAPIGDPMQRLRVANRLVSGNPDHVESHFLLGRLAMAAGLVGEARRHAEAAKRRGLGERRLWILLADIEEAEQGDTEAGRAAQRDALRRAAAAPPDSGWFCAACGTRTLAWQPSCPACGAVGRLSWRAVPATA